MTSHKKVTPPGDNSLIFLITTHDSLGHPVA
jgi:hypothetical protein